MAKKIIKMGLSKMKNRPIMSVICLFISCCLLAACGGNSGATSAVTSVPSTPTDQKTDPMPSGSVSTDPATSSVSVPSEPDPDPTTSTSIPVGDNAFGPQPNPDLPNPWVEYPTLTDVQKSGNNPRQSIFDFYPANKEMAIVMALGAEDIVSYAENLGWQQYTGDDNINFYYGADSWDSPDVISRISYMAPQGFFVIYYRFTLGSHNLFYFYTSEARDTIGNDVFSTELVDCMKSLLDKMMSAGVVETNTPASRELYSFFYNSYKEHYFIGISPELTIEALNITYTG